MRTESKRTYDIDWADVIGASVITLICIVVVAVAAYGIYMTIHNHLDAGWLAEKQYVPAHTGTTTVMIRAGKAVIPMRRHYHHDESYIFIVTLDDKKDKWTVSAKQYNSAEIGDWVERGKINDKE